MVRPGNRTGNITAPIIGFTELRHDLNQFEVPVVLSKNPRFQSPHDALQTGNDEWFARGMDVVEAAQHAQFLSGKHLSGFLLQRLVVHAEEAYGQFQARSTGPEVPHD